MSQISSKDYFVIFVIFLMIPWTILKVDWINDEFILLDRFVFSFLSVLD